MPFFIIVYCSSAQIETILWHLQENSTSQKVYTKWNNEKCLLDMKKSFTLERGQFGQKLIPIGTNFHRTLRSFEIDFHIGQTPLIIFYIRLFSFSFFFFFFKFLNIPYLTIQPSLALTGQSSYVAWCSYT